MKFIPLNDFVIVKKIAGDTTSPGGILYKDPIFDYRATIIEPPRSSDEDQFLTDSFRFKLNTGDTVLMRWVNASQIEGDFYAVDKKEIVCKILAD